MINLTTTLSEHDPAQKLHMPLIAELVERFRYAGASLPADIVKGAPIVGGLPSINSFPSKVTPAAMGLGDVMGGIRVIHAKVRKSLSKSNDLLIGQKWRAGVLGISNKRAVIGPNTCRGF